MCLTMKPTGTVYSCCGNLEVYGTYLKNTRTNVLKPGWLYFLKDEMDNWTLMVEWKYIRRRFKLEEHTVCNLPADFVEQCMEGTFSIHFENSTSVYIEAQPDNSDLPDIAKLLWEIKGKRLHDTRIIKPISLEIDRRRAERLAYQSKLVDFWTAHLAQKVTLKRLFPPNTDFTIPDSPPRESNVSSIMIEHVDPRSIASDKEPTDRLDTSKIISPNFLPCYMPGSIRSVLINADKFDFKGKGKKKTKSRKTKSSEKRPVLGKTSGPSVDKSERQREKTKSPVLITVKPHGKTTPIIREIKTNEFDEAEMIKRVFAPKIPALRSERFPHIYSKKDQRTETGIRVSSPDSPAETRTSVPEKHYEKETMDHLLTPDVRKKRPIPDKDDVKDKRSRLLTPADRPKTISNIPEKEEPMVSRVSPAVRLKSSPEIGQDESEGEVLKRIPYGFKNLGNTCYMNSALQALFYAVLNCEVGDIPFMALHDQTRFQLTKDSVFWNFCRLLELIKSKNSDSNILGCLMNMQRCFQRKHPTFKTGTQQDAHEYLTCLFAAVNEELRPLESITNRTVIDSYFEIIISETITCTGCTRDVIIPQVMYDCGVNIPANPETSLQATLSSIFKTGDHRDYRCEVCHCPKSTSTITLHTFPRIFLIYVNRYSRSAAKIVTPFKVPKFLYLDQLASETPDESIDNLCEDVGHTSIPKCNGNGDNRANYTGRTSVEDTNTTRYHYQLTSYIFHRGNSTNEGHYLSYAHDSGGRKYFCFDDAEVYPVSEEKFITDASHSYVLMYVQLITN